MKKFKQAFINFNTNSAPKKYQTVMDLLLRTNSGSDINNTNDYIHNNINTNDYRITNNSTNTNDYTDIMYDSSGQHLPTSRTLSHSTNNAVQQINTIQRTLSSFKDKPKSTLLRTVGDYFYYELNYEGETYIIRFNRRTKEFLFFMNNYNFSLNEVTKDLQNILIEEMKIILERNHFL